MSEQSTQRPSRRFEAESVPEIRQKLADFDCPFGHLAAHNALRLLLRSHDDLVAALRQAIDYMDDFDADGLGTKERCRVALAKAEGKP